MAAFPARRQLFAAKEAIQTAVIALPKPRRFARIAQILRETKGVSLRMTNL